MNWFKNIQIKSKLLTSFSIVIVFAIIIAGLAAFGVNRLEESYSYILMFPQKRLEYLMLLNTACSDMRRATTAVTLNLGDAEVIDGYWNQYEQAYNSAISSLDSYLEINNSDTRRDISVRDSNSQSATNMKKQFESYKANVVTAVAFAKQSDFNSTNDTFLAGASIIADISEVVSGMVSRASAYINDVSDANRREKDSIILLLVILLFVIVIVSIVIALYISGLIAKPLGFLTRALELYGFRGDTELPPDVAESAMACMQRKDEIGICARAFGAMLQHIQTVEQTLGLVADGDLTAEIKELSEKDGISIAINKMIDSLNNMFTEIRMASDQVSSGAGQVSYGAQQLASGSSQQAASIEEFSATLMDLQEKTNYNAENSTKARDVNAETGERLKASIVSMGEMLNAMKEIDESSNNITKVIKVIDDIAFQTNILALNAAVEAARAGQYGKGFAVVADEVRSLASKSASAAKETADLIEGSSARVKEGNQIVEKTNADLEIAAQYAQQSIQLIEEVTVASNEQAKAIHEINQGIEQISSVVHANSATAEESAATSQQMSAQSSALNDIIARFKLNGTALNAPAIRQLNADETDFNMNPGKD